MNTYIEQIKEFFSRPGLSIEYFNNSLGDYLAALLILIVLVIVFKAVQHVILRKLAVLAEKTETDIDDTLVKIIQSLKPGFYSFVAFFFSIKALELSSFAVSVVNAILVSWIALQTVIALHILIDYIIEKKFDDLDGDGEPDNGIVSFMAGLVKAALWIVAALMVLSNLGVNVTGLMAGIGIGGLAIAFALKEVFADLFASFSIYLDKPFQVGDYVVVGKHSGSIEKIGIKTTRIRASQGEEIVISNQEMTSVRVQNFKKLKERRLSMQFGVIYGTSNTMLQKIPDIIQKIVDGESGVRFNRVFFTTFGDSALLFDLVYYVESDVYVDFLQAQQNINFKIKEVFEQEGIEMAFPTQTIYLQKELEKS